MVTECTQILTVSLAGQPEWSLTLCLVWTYGYNFHATSDLFQLCSAKESEWKWEKEGERLSSQLLTRTQHCMWLWQLCGISGFLSPSPQAQPNPALIWLAWYHQPKGINAAPLNHRPEIQHQFYWLHYWTFHESLPVTCRCVDEHWLLWTDNIHGEYVCVEKVCRSISKSWV